MGTITAGEIKKKTTLNGLLIFLFALILFSLHFLALEHASSNFINFDRHALFIILIFIASFFLFRKFYIFISLQTIAIVVFVLYLVISAYINNRVEYITVILICFLVFIVLRPLFRRNKLIFFYGFVLSNLLTSVLYLTDIRVFEFLDFLSTNSSINTGLNANYFASIIPFSTALFLDKRWVSKNKILLCLNALLVVLSIYIVFLSHSRISWLAILIALPFVLVRLGKNSKFQRLFCNHFSVTGLTIILLFFCYFLYKLNPNSVQGRFLIYKVTSNLISSNLLLGCGPGGFSSNYNLYQAEYFENNRSIPENYELLAANTYDAFNEPLQIIAEFGLIGFLLLILIILTVAYSLKKRRLNFYSIGSVGSLLSVIICGLMSYPLSLYSTLINCIFFISVLPDLQKRVIIVDKLRRYGNVVKIIFLLGSFYLGYKQFQVAKSEHIWSRAALLGLEENFLEANVEFKKCYPYLKGDGRFMFDYGSELSYANMNVESIRVLKLAAKLYPNDQVFINLGETYQAVGNYSKALEAYSTARYIFPSRFSSRYKKLKLYEKIGNQKNALTEAKGIVSLPVKVPSGDVDFIKMEAKRFIEINK